MSLHFTGFSTARPPRIASGSLTSSCSATSPLLPPSSGGSSPTSLIGGAGGYERYANRVHVDVMSASATAALSSPSEMFAGKRSPKENYVAVTINPHPVAVQPSQANNNHSRR